MIRPSVLSASVTAVIALTLGGFWLRAQQEETRSLPSLLPSGALLYLEAKNFQSVLNQWNLSTEKKSWLASENFEILSRSRLLQRLGQAQDEFASVAGLPVQFNLLNEVAGSRSAFAFYDLPSLGFVYITQLDSSHLNTNQLWRSRTKYESRQAAGIPFFVKSDPASHRSVAFARYKNWFVVGTAEERMARTLALISGARAAALENEPWFSSVTKQSAGQGDLRLVYNLDALLSTPQFRTYWIQRNSSELKAFMAGVADLFERQRGFEEQRVLVRREGAQALATAPSIAEILHYIPAASSLYRIWAHPDHAIVSDVLQQVVFGAPAGNPTLDRFAPQVTGQASESGSNADFETRVDEPPPRRAEAQSIAQLVEVVTGMQPVAMAHIQIMTVLGDNVFLIPQSATVIECQKADRAALGRALQASTNILETGSLDPLNVAVSGNTIILSRMNITRSEASTQFPAGTTYAAVFDKSVEWPRYKQLFGVIDRNAMNPEAPPSANSPTFFAGNIRSLGDTLSRLQRVSITAQDGATERRETLRYEMSTP